MTASSEVFHISTGMTETAVKAAFNAAMVALAPDSDDRIIVVNKQNLVLLGKYEI